MAETINDLNFASPEYLEGRICQMAEELGEHCESVRIFVTRRDGSSTGGFTIGKGNAYAQRWQVAEWLNKQNEQDRIEQRSYQQ